MARDEVANGAEDRVREGQRSDHVSPDPAGQWLLRGTGVGADTVLWLTEQVVGTLHSLARLTEKCSSRARARLPWCHAACLGTL